MHFDTCEKDSILKSKWHIKINKNIMLRFDIKSEIVFKYYLIYDII